MFKKYNKKKEKNQVMEKLVKKHVSPNRHRVIRECCSWMNLIADEDVIKTKVNNANSCKCRLCPVCAGKIAKSDAFKISVMERYIEEECNKAFIMVTQTAPNVKGDMLKQEITKFNRKFNKAFLCYEEIKGMNYGYIRKLEVTYNSEKIITYDMWHGTKYRKPGEEKYRMLGLEIGDPNPDYDTYHTHFHVIFAVDKYYFKSRKYIKRDKWLKYWQDAMQDERITQVFVERAGRNSKFGKEMGKYIAKDSDYLYSQGVFDVFFKSFQNRQVITYGGIFKEAKKKFKAKELDHYIDEDLTEYVYSLMVVWGYGKYVEIDRTEL